MRTVFVFLSLAISCQEFTLRENNLQYDEANFEVFEYFPPPDAVDILTVVDQSCSMINNWGHWVEQAQLVTEELSHQPIGWRLGFVSADPQFASALVGERYLDSSAEDLAIDTLLLAIEVSSQSGYYEQGMAAAFTAYTSLEDFFRPEAALYFVLLSDEPDQSGISVNIWDDSWSAMLPPELPFTVTSIVPLADAQPTSTVCPESPGTGYLDVTELNIDICKEDRWYEAYSLVNELAYPVVEFPLESTPHPETILVWIGDDPSTDWMYLEEENSLLLNEPPPAYALVGVSYYPKESLP